jgi:hypothetical protein
MLPNAGLQQLGVIYFTMLHYSGALLPSPPLSINAGVVLQPMLREI